jgi:phospholipid transport system substrate-binding protein
MTLSSRTVMWITLASLLLANYGLRVEAAEPLEQVRQMLEQVIVVLHEQSPNTPEQSQKRQEKLHQIVSQTFAFKETAQRALGPHWYKLTPEQRQEYLQTFSELLEASFVARIAYRGKQGRQGYGTVPSTIEYLQETVEPDGYAFVHTTMAYPLETGKEEIEFLLLKHNNNWLIYDIVTDGASMITNYRTQFDKIIRQESYAELIKRLRTSYRHSLSSTEEKSRQ